MAQGDA
jgi:hypothetical protein